MDFSFVVGEEQGLGGGSRKSRRMDEDSLYVKMVLTIEQIEYFLYLLKLFYILF